MALLMARPFGLLGIVLVRRARGLPEQWPCPSVGRALQASIWAALETAFGAPSVRNRTSKPHISDASELANEAPLS